MKAKVSYLLSLLLPAVFVVATVGVPVTRNICMITGHANITLYTGNGFQSCCSKNKGCTDKQENKARCCDQEHEYLQMEIDSKLEPVTAWKSTVPSITILTTQTSMVAMGNPAQSNFIASDLPPPRQGADIRLLLVTLRC